MFFQHVKAQFILIRQRITADLKHTSQDVGHHFKLLWQSVTCSGYTVDVGKEGSV